jgi:hypothetical protein
MENLSLVQALAFELSRYMKHPSFDALGATI